MRVKEVLSRMGVGRERELKPFEKARKAMEEAGGRELAIRLAAELREKGDPSAIVEEKKQREDDCTNRLILRYDLQESTSDTPTRWFSKEASIVAVSTGKIFTETSYFPNDLPMRLDDVVSVVNQFRMLSRPYTPPVNLKSMSLEEQFRIAIRFANPIPDFRYGEGEQSLKQKPVKSKISKRIF